MSNSHELDWPEFRAAISDRLHVLGQLDSVALLVEASALHDLLQRGRELLGSADPFGPEDFDASTAPVVLLRALVRIARIQLDEPVVDLAALGEVVESCAQEA